MRHAIEVLLFLAVLTVAAAAQNPTPTTIPNGLPEWAFNIPDKVQPPEPKVPAVVRAPATPTRRTGSLTNTRRRRAA
jgi:hypothetical protein